MLLVHHFDGFFGFLNWFFKAFLLNSYKNLRAQFGLYRKREGAHKVSSREVKDFDEILALAPINTFRFFLWYCLLLLIYVWTFSKHCVTIIIVSSNDFNSHHSLCNLAILPIHSKNKPFETKAMKIKSHICRELLHVLLHQIIHAKEH